MSITAKQVKELRELTGAGMMECKKALVETAGDQEKAIELMRKKGLSQAAKKADRTASEGMVAIAIDDSGKRAGIAEINSETDFVAQGDAFQGFVKEVAEQILASGATDAAALLESELPTGETVESKRKALIAQLGENLQVRRSALVTASQTLGHYLHGRRIGVVVALEGGDDALAKDIAMHIAAANPKYLDADAVPGNELEKEREILKEQAKGSGKPDNIIDKMVDGRIKKYLAEITLLGQAFIKDPDQTIEKLLADSNAKIASYTRFEVGEGIEKKVENFAEEVRAQVEATG